METAVIGGKRVEVIPYDAYPHQADLERRIIQWVTRKNGAQFFVPVWHRRSGKSSCLVNILFRIASAEGRPGQFYYFYPQQKKIREHIWENPDVVQKYLPRSQIKHCDNQRMIVFFKNGSQVIFDGTDENPDKHRGGSGAAYVVDEYDDQQPRVFREIIRPIVEFNQGWVVLSGTPRGVKQLHDAYQAGQDSLRPRWWSGLLPATQSTTSEGTRLFPEHQLKEIEKDYGADGIKETFNQEYLCEFIAGEAQVFRKTEAVVLDEFGVPLKEETNAHPLKHYRIGCDPALTSDYWVNSVFDLHTHKEVSLERFQPFSSTLGEARTEALCRKWNTAEIFLDESGIGAPIGDHLRLKGLPIRPVKTGVQKAQLITNLSLKVDELSVRFLPDEVAMAEMRDFSFERLPSGHYRFQAPDGKHDDTVVARALAVWELGPKFTSLDRDPHTWNPFERPAEAIARQQNTYYGVNRRVNE